MQADRETLQERRLLLQALPSTGEIHLGYQGLACLMTYWSNWDLGSQFKSVLLEVFDSCDNYFEMELIKTETKFPKLMTALTIDNIE